MSTIECNNYPDSVYEDAWEDLGVMYESWKSVHGVDHAFCIKIIQKFVDHLDSQRDWG